MIAIGFAFILTAIWIMLLAIHKVASRQNRILNQMGYHLVELHNITARIRAQTDTQLGDGRIDWNSWEDK